jgi:hypothetical protein
MTLPSDIRAPSEPGVKEDTKLVGIVALKPRMTSV